LQRRKSVLRKSRVFLFRLGLRRCILLAAACLLTLPLRKGHAEVIWIEGENPVRSSMHRHPWWYDKVQRDKLSGGDFISNWDPVNAGEATYQFTASANGNYEFWVRANPVGTSLKYRLNGGDLTPIDTTKNVDSMNIAEGNALDVRFIAWMDVGNVALKKGTNTIDFRMDSQNNHHGSLDCFLFTTDPFEPHGSAKPGETPAAVSESDGPGWFAFDPKPDPFAPSEIDLRFLNERAAGDGGFIGVRNGEFIHTTSGKPVRFWAVNGPPADMNDPGELAHTARMLAKHGVNMVRIHGGYFDDDGNVVPDRVNHALDVVRAMKVEGIYSHFSVYFPLWLKPKPNTPWLEGYDGTRNSFAALFFNPQFQQRYRSWWKALLLTPDPNSGKRLVDEPAVSSVELVNEDSYLFWTFDAKQIPDAQLRIIEAQFAGWLTKKYGSIDAALAAWNGLADDRDNTAEGRVGFRPLWNIANQRTQRDQDTVAFLVESQRNFYSSTIQFLRGIGFKGVITASNWITASPKFLGPLEKYSYTVGDFIDRHGYFGTDRAGDNAGWSIRDGQTYFDRSALRFDPEEPGKPRAFVNSVMDPHYDGKPSMLSETTFERPNRYRSEAPLYCACYGSLQGSNAIAHFALDGGGWSVKPGYFMQPWTLMSPAMMGQFPAAALIFRNRLIDEGDELVHLTLKPSELMALKGTPLAQDAAVDELRLKDVPGSSNITSDTVVDPLVHFAGRANLRFSEAGGPSIVGDLSHYIDHRHQTVVSTNGQLRLDYGRGLLTIDAPCAEGICGALDDAGSVRLRDVTIASPMQLGEIIVVSLDGKPLATSAKMLLQVMSEERPSGFQSESLKSGLTRIVSIGQDPWRVKDLSGSVKFKGPGAGDLQVTPLDLNGYPRQRLAAATQVKLDRQTIYYLIAR
jgi:hypothetical protein